MNRILISLALGGVVAAGGVAIAKEPAPPAAASTTGYLGSLVYLAVFGSIIAFGCYLSLIGSIGADRAAYSTLLFPLVALGISTIWEGYQWSAASLTGVCFILVGNFFILTRKKVVPAVRPALNSKLAITEETI